MYDGDMWGGVSIHEYTTRASLLVSVLLLGMAPALAADVSSSKTSSSEKTSSEKAKTPAWTFSIDGTPEIYAIDNGSNRAGNLNNIYYKAGLSYRFTDNFLGGVSFQHSFKNGGGMQFYAEATLGYKFKVNDNFTLTPSIGPGYTWDDTGIIKGANTNASIGYYVIYLAGDLKVTSKLTWNAFNLRYRNGFNATWVTPKVATGLTYDFDSDNAVFLNVGYAWKKLDTSTPPYNALAGDKINFSLGYKRSF
ncbi:hypothetical protein [Mesorhizobium sp. KR1-2]|uniref:hypothetical protein n=1 Tax=Mesorhizobium sp. KR1-2 TaxID=3156609 RepID=UPI0032B5C2D9